MESVVYIRSRGEFKICPFSIASGKGAINDVFNSKHIVVFYKPGLIAILDEKDIAQSKDIGTVTVFNSRLGNRILTFRNKDCKFVDYNSNSAGDITGKFVDGKYKGKQLEIESHGNHFAFDWLAFHPDTQIYE